VGESIAIQRWDAIYPAEHNAFSLFVKDLEENPLVLFHATPKRLMGAIVASGFRSAASLGTGDLKSVSYAKRSAGCLAHIGNGIDEDYVVLAVEFKSLNGVVNNISDIHVFDPEIQPRILGYCELPRGFHVR
jgi:hypothetical protein